MKNRWIATLIFFALPALGAPSPASSPGESLLQKINEQEKAIEALDEEIDVLDQKSDNHLTDLEDQISQQQAVIGALEGAQQRSKQEVFEDYAERERGIQEYLLTQDRQLEQLAAQLRTDQIAAQNELQQIRNLEQKGIAFDELGVRRVRFDEMSRRINQLQTELESALLEHEREKSLFQRERIWQVKEDQERLKNQNRQEIERERSKLADLKKQYDTLQKQEEDRKRKREELEEKYISQMHTYEDLLDQYRSERATSG